ncbi:type VII secretion system-associated protein [Saccharopolyspora sp. NPDC050389]|uniref:type VII secretion system-associated protein n=1 Tax=Saccharopolyspora sp. NPDC050389 TaxID=3155516 RepID=UPI0033FC9CDC
MSEDETPETAPVAEGEPVDQWVVLIDPDWKPEPEQQQPPETAIVGSWYIDSDGSLRDFRPNRAYEPSSPDSPTDPVDATLRLVMRGELPAPELLASLPGSHLLIGLDEEHTPIVTRAPDGKPSVLVLTAFAHAERLTVPAWAEITAEEVADALPEEGVDVLLNPGAPASTRIGAQEFRDAVRGPGGDHPDTAGAPGEGEPGPAAEQVGAAGPAESSRITDLAPADVTLLG